MYRFRLRRRQDIIFLRQQQIAIPIVALKNSVFGEGYLIKMIIAMREMTSCKHEVRDRTIIV